MKAHGKRPSSWWWWLTLHVAMRWLTSHKRQHVPSHNCATTRDISQPVFTIAIYACLLPANRIANINWKHTRKYLDALAPNPDELRASSAPGTGSIWTVEMGKSNQVKSNGMKRNGTSGGATHPHLQLVVVASFRLCGDLFTTTKRKWETEHTRQKSQRWTDLPMRYSCAERDCRDTYDKETQSNERRIGYLGYLQ